MALAATLPHNDYFRASALGAGAFGSVVVVYNEDGQEFAAKVFDRDDDDEYDEEDEDEEDESSSSCNGIDVGALREMSMLRYLNGAHPNVMRMVDVSRLEDQFCMIMPKLAGSLSAAIEGKGLTNKMKAQIAALLLHAVSWMASHCVMHRDIKPDNVLLTDESLPVLTDFSLAKLVEPASSASSGARDGSGGGKGKKGKAGKKRGAGEVEQGGAKQTAGMGTPTYTAPEIVAGGDDYGTQADVWSLGIVLYELFHGEMLSCHKDKHALAHIEEVKTKLSDKPIPNLLRAMLQVDPSERITAAAALEQLPGKDKVTMPEVGPLLDPATLAPGDAAEPAGAPPACSPRKRTKGPKGGGAALLTPRRLCELLELESPRSAAAAEHYWRVSAAARARGPAGMAACALLAAKNYEIDLHSPDEACGAHPLLAEYDEAEYEADELAILKDLDYCLVAP